MLVEKRKRKVFKISKHLQYDFTHTCLLLFFTGQNRLIAPGPITYAAVATEGPR